MQKTTDRLFNCEFISLSALFQQTDVYEELPVMLQENLKRSVWLTLITNITFLWLSLILLPLEDFYVFPGGFYIVPFTADWHNTLLWLLSQFMPILMICNLISLMATIGVLVISVFMTAPVREPIHWLAALCAIPTGVTILTALITIGIVGIMILINLVVWVLIIVFACLIFVGMVSSR